MVQHLAYKLRGMVTNVYSYALACNVVGACATENLHKPMVENIISLLPFVLLGVCNNNNVKCNVKCDIQGLLFLQV